MTWDSSVSSFYSIPNSVISIEMTRVRNFRISRSEVYAGRSMRLKQVCERGKIDVFIGVFARQNCALFPSYEESVCMHTMREQRRDVAEGGEERESVRRQESKREQEREQEGARAREARRGREQKSSSP